MKSELTLEITDLSLMRGFRRVIDGFNTKLPAATGFWLWGANGVGKTTLLRAMAGYLRPAMGKILLSVQGEVLSPLDENYRNQVLFLPARAPVKGALTVNEQWQLWQKIFNSDSEIPVTLNLQNHLHQRIGKLSAGQQRRLSLGLLSLTRRHVWILDEAFNHLDTDGEAWLLGAIKNHMMNGGIVIVAAPHAATDSAFLQRQL